MSTPSLANPRVEDNAHLIDLSGLQTSSKVVFGGTDYGLATMSKTVPLTTSVIQTHLNRFQILNDMKDESVDMPPFTPLPPAFSITAPQLDSTTHTISVRRKRERKLAKDESVKTALKAVSEQSFATATSMSDVDKAQEVRRKHGQTLREFYASAQQQHDSHHQELRTARAYQVFASNERKFLQNYGRAHPAVPPQTMSGGPPQDVLPQPPQDAHLEPHQDVPPEPSQDAPQLVSLEPTQSAPPGPPQTMSAPQRIIPIHCIGDAGTGTGSRIKGFSRRGGKRLRKEHRQHTVVAITPEYRTSKTCSFCFFTLQKVRH